MKVFFDFATARLQLLAMAVAVGCAMGSGISSVSAAEPNVAVQGLIDKAATQGSVRVIVMLAVGNQIESFLSSAQVEDQRKQIRQAQDAVIALLESAPSRAMSSLQGLTRFEVTPGFAANITADDLQLLRASPLVADIVEDVAVPPTLMDSVPLIGGSPTTGFSGYTGSGWAVAILDTGVQKTHPFIDGKVISEACYSTNDANYSSSSVCPGGVDSSTASGSGANCSGADGCDHGTHVAGIAAGRSPNLSGVARDANIIAVQVFSKFSSSNYCGSVTPCVLTFNSDQIRGLERVYALSSTYKIAAVNMSLGGGSYTSNCDTDPRKPIIDQLKGAGIATVIASGNSGYTNSISAPSCISSAVAVGSTTKSDVVADYSNSSPLIDLLAPGTSIYSSIPTDSYAYLSGTSMATPHVVGAFAVLKSAKPSATPNEIQQLLESSGISIIDGRNGITKPRIDLNRALQAININPIDQPVFFVKQQYLDFLGRQPNENEVNYWVDFLNTNAHTRSEVIYGFFGSPEFQVGTAPIARLYFSFFNRIPDYDGLEYHRRMHSTGTPLVSIAQAFADSTEFRNTYGNLSNEQYVNQLYLNVLGRAPDADGMRYWVDFLNRGGTRGEAMLGFSESPEYIKRSYAWVQVSMMYQIMLRRSAEQVGFDSWVNKLANGESILTLIDGFANSQEYRSRF